MQELESNLSYCYTQILTNFQYIEHYLNLLAFKQNFAEITTTCIGTRKQVETFKKNILIFSHVIVCHPTLHKRAGGRSYPSPSHLPIVSVRSVCVQIYVYLILICMQIYVYLLNTYRVLPLNGQKTS